MSWDHDTVAYRQHIVGEARHESMMAKLDLIMVHLKLYEARQSSSSIQQIRKYQEDEFAIGERIKRAKEYLQRAESDLLHQELKAQLAQVMSDQVSFADSTHLNEASHEDTQEHHVHEQMASVAAAAKDEEAHEIPPTHQEEKEEEETIVAHASEHDEEDMGFDVPSFEGSENPKEFLDWCLSLEKLFDCNNFAEEKMLQIATMKLTKDASCWYYGFNLQRQQKGKHKMRSWPELKVHMLSKFAPSNYEQPLLFCLQDLMQEHDDASSYMLVCNGVEFSGGNEDLKEEIIRFDNGLLNPIKTKLHDHLDVVADVDNYHEQNFIMSTDCHDQVLCDMVSMDSCAVLITLFAGLKRNVRHSWFPASSVTIDKGDLFVNDFETVKEHVHGCKDLLLYSLGGWVARILKWPE